MSHPINLSNIQIIHISELKKGTKLLNLGKVLEIEEMAAHYNFIISRMNEKQVLKFEKEMFVATIY